MRKSFVVCAVLAFACLARADVDFGDIVRWGLMRKADVFPVGGGTLMSPTSGVLRVIEARQVVDQTRLSMTVVSNLVVVYENHIFLESNIVIETHTYAISNGVYVSGALQPLNGGFQCAFVNKEDTWPFSFTPEDIAFGDGPLTHQLLASPGEVAGFSATNAWNSFPAVIYGNYPTNAPPSGMAIIDYYRYTEMVTNDFVSATMLQDVIDDLRQEISEAIEAHVQLLH